MNRPADRQSKKIFLECFFCKVCKKNHFENFHFEHIIVSMKKITLTFPDKSSIEIENEIRPLALMGQLEKACKCDKKIWAVKVNNEICSLDSPININAELDPVYEDTKEGAAIYRRSLCFLLACASHKLFPGARLLVGHSLGYGYFYTLEKENFSSKDVDALKEEMLSLVKEDFAIENDVISYREACQIFEDLGLKETRKQLDYISPGRIQVNRLSNFCDLNFGVLVASTGVLKVFDLMPYEEGFLLRFPKHDQPDRLTEFQDQKKLFQIYKKYKEWGKQLDVTSAASLNKIIHDRKVDDFIDITETLQVKRISEIADQIHDKGSVRVILIAGPSSSGKTTSAKKLGMQLEAIGYKPKVISLDNYYVGRTQTPLDENGNYDYECLEALNVKLLNENLIDLFEGKEIKVPSYNFNEGLSYFKEGNTLKLEKNEILVLEGIHGLNPKLTPLVPEDYKFKIYLSALTQLNLDDHNRIATSDNRLVRRIVRDSQFRGKSAADTIAMWDNVQKGERLHIFPFQNNADAMLNTALDYEMSVLKVYADPLLRCVSPLQKEYGEASRLLKFLSYFSTIPATAVPPHSIIREFIGGSAFHY